MSAVRVNEELTEWFKITHRDVDYHQICARSVQPAEEAEMRLALNCVNAGVILNTQLNNLRFADKTSW